MNTIRLRLLVLSLVAALSWLPVLAAGEEEVNNGQDITRPLTRFDIRYEYQNAPGSENDSINVFTLRVDKPIKLAERWQLGTRFDLPFMSTTRASADNPDGGPRFGLSDALAQALLIHTPSQNFAYAIGAQVILPTASQDQMGGGKYRIVPTLGARWTTNHILKGSWIALAARWDKDIGGYRDGAPHVSELQFAPVINIPLPKQWFINLFPSTDIRYNIGEKRSIDSGRLFLPANVMVGKMLRKNMVGSVEVGVPIINEYKVYDFKTEFRIGILF